MVPSRNGPRGAEVASFGLAIFLYVLTPTQVGNQDIVGARDARIALARSLDRFDLRHDPLRDVPHAAAGRHADSGAAARSPRKPRLERRHRLARSRSRGAFGRSRLPDDQSRRQGRPAGAEPRRRNRSSRRTPSKRRPGRPSCRRARRPPRSSRTTTPTANCPMRRRSCSPTSRATRTAAMRRPQAGRDRRRDACRAVPRIRHLAVARDQSEDRDRRSGRSRPTSIRPNSRRMRRRASKA